MSRNMLLLTSLAVLVSLPTQAEKSNVENVVTMYKDVGQEPFVMNPTTIVICEANEVEYLICDQCPLMGTVLPYHALVGQEHRPSDHQLAAGLKEDGRFPWEAGLLRPGWRSTFQASSLSASYSNSVKHSSAGGLERSWF